jgi:hypothetical protein
MVVVFVSLSESVTEPSSASGPMTMRKSKVASGEGSDAPAGDTSAPGELGGGFMAVRYTKTLVVGLENRPCDHDNLKTGRRTATCGP